MKYCALFIIFLILSISCSQQNTQHVNKKLFVGNWISEDDKNYTMIINDSLVIEYYQKEKTNTLSYQINKENLIEIVKENNEIYKYNIVSITNNRMVLIYLDRGYTLKFVKSK